VSPIPNDADVVGALNPNALLAVDAAGWPNSDDVEPNAEPNPPPAAVPNPVVPVAPNAGVVDVAELLPKPPNPGRQQSSSVQTVITSDIFSNLIVTVT